MKNSLPKELILSNPKQWRALSSSVRLQMVDRLRMIGPCAVPSLAAELDRAPDGLYHHIRILERAGLVRRIGEESTGTRKQAVYSLVAEDVRLPVDRADPKATRHFVKVTGSVLRTAERGVAAAISAGGIKQTGPARDLWCRIHTGRINEERLARLNALLAEMEAEMDHGGSSREGRTMSLVVALWPVTARRRYATNDVDRKSKSGKPRKRTK